MERVQGEATCLSIGEGVERAVPAAKVLDCVFFRGVAEVDVFLYFQAEGLLSV
jgi:hypothetical protein